MKRRIRTLEVTCAAIIAITAMVAASASAAPVFTANEEGNLEGWATANHVFTPAGGGAATCKKAAITGEIVALKAAWQNVSVQYAECSAFGFVAAMVGEANYRLHANGEVDLLNAIKITVPLGFCSTRVEPKEGLKAVSYENAAGGGIEQKSEVEGIESVGGGLCPGGKNGTYTGASFIERVGGGNLFWDE